MNIDKLYDLEEFEKYEANDYLSKPIDVFKFVNKIENLIK